jgi:hypothetical protein
MQRQSKPLFMRGMIDISDLSGNPKYWFRHQTFEFNVVVINVLRNRASKKKNIIWISGRGQSAETNVERGFESLSRLISPIKGIAALSASNSLFV